jgi:L-amino acid N-acyltransferase YncA
MARTRSEYRLSPLNPGPPPSTRPERWTIRAPDRSDRERLATAILNAYRGTIDDEGEDHDAALVAVDEALGRAEDPHSIVLELDGEIVAVSFVVEVGGRKYIDPVATVASHKREGLAHAAVSWSLRSLHQHGEREVGAVITDGNTASERLFAALGFVRVGGWG